MVQLARGQGGCVMLVLISVLGCSGVIQTYPPTPGALYDDRLALSVAASVAGPGSNVIILERELGCDVRSTGPPPRPSSRARFASDGPVFCSLTLATAFCDTPSLLALPIPILRAQGIDVPVKAACTSSTNAAANITFSFTLPGPGAYYMRIDNSTSHKLTSHKLVPEVATVAAPDRKSNHQAKQGCTPLPSHTTWIYFWVDAISSLTPPLPIGAIVDVTKGCQLLSCE